MDQLLNILAENGVVGLLLAIAIYVIREMQKENRELQGKVLDLIKEARDYDRTILKEQFEATAALASAVEFIKERGQ